MTIEVRREWVWAMLGVGLLAAISFLGLRVSPHAADGRPVLLLPEIRQVELYRQQAVRWTEAWRVQETGLLTLLTAPAADLLAQSQAGQQTLGEAVSLANAVDAAEAPEALVGLRDQSQTTAAAFVEAGRAVNRWLSAPSAENLAAAQSAYQTAAAALAVIEANAWIAPDLAPLTER